MKNILTFQQIKIADYDYPLPEKNIAYYPLPQRDHSKLLVYKNQQITDSSFEQAVDFLDKDMLLVFNDSKVIHARIHACTDTGARVEIFCLEPLSPETELSKAFACRGIVTWKCFVRNAKRWKTPLRLKVSLETHDLEVWVTRGAEQDGAFPVTFAWNDEQITFSDWLETRGKMPLPPYIKRETEPTDEQRYQTIYARHEGSVAAPTAGLHFSYPVLQQLQERQIPCANITLHVGAGTFKPVTTDSMGNHFMHREQIEVSIELIDTLLNHRSHKAIAVGTTVGRALESLYLMGVKLQLHKPNPFHVEQWEYYQHPEWQKISMIQSLTALHNYMQNQNMKRLWGSTELLILPGYRFSLLKGLFTNFHQPKSTLLLMVAALLGNSWKDIYRHALTHNYRFLSYGDANLYLL
ncbi:MAG: S-adenosylmethionine:tRNA ribosyltransferase-isomerase [Bacteroidales bacterium]|jgi:S-adenosylmethionine:tRNA ribosyltransferase-isomerase|nr:S-adenosylmethionine:tRNA ribosyltransferase-isomerase [Bacteroidales bacterium]